MSSFFFHLRFINFMMEKNSFPSLLLETERKKETGGNFKYQHNRVSEDCRPGCEMSQEDRGLHGGPRVLLAFCANTLGVSLCSFHLSWAFKSSGAQQWSEENHHLQKRNLAIRNQVGGWGNKRWFSGLSPPSSIKHASQSHFTPQHLPTVPERYTYSSFSKMFMERNYQQEKTNSLARYCHLWDNYFCGSIDNGDGVWLECGLSGRAGRCHSPKIPEQGDFATLEPAYLTRLKETVTVKFLRLKGSGRRRPFLLKALKACSGSQARRHKTKRNHWKKPPPPPTLSQLLQAGGFYSSGATDTGLRTCKPFKALEKSLHITNILINSKIQNENSKIEI